MTGRVVFDKRRRGVGIGKQMRYTFRPRKTGSLRSLLNFFTTHCLIDHLTIFFMFL